MEFWRFIASIELVTLFICCSQNGYCAQLAEVTSEDAMVFDAPLRNSKTLTFLKKGTKVQTSSFAKKDTNGMYWYRIQIAAKGFGYIPATDLKTAEFLPISEKEFSTSEFPEKKESFTRNRWFSLRAMEIFGTKTKPSAAVIGQDFEVSFFLPAFGRRDYLRHWIGLGVAYMDMDPLPALTGCIVIRLSQNGKIQPEFRMRVGEFLNSHQLVAGSNLGINIHVQDPTPEKPFSLFSISLEIGSLSQLGSPGLHVWGAMGFGVHF